MCACSSRTVHEPRLCLFLRILQVLEKALLETLSRLLRKCSLEEYAPVVAAGTARLQISPMQLPGNFTREELTVEVLVNVSHRQMVLKRITPSTGPSTGEPSYFPSSLNFCEMLPSFLSCHPTLGNLSFLISVRVISTLVACVSWFS